MTNAMAVLDVSHSTVRSRNWLACYLVQKLTLCPSEPGGPSSDAVLSFLSAASGKQLVERKCSVAVSCVMSLTAGAFAVQLLQSQSPSGTAGKGRVKQSMCEPRLHTSHKSMTSSRSALPQISHGCSSSTADLSAPGAQQGPSHPPTSLGVPNQDL